MDSRDGEPVSDLVLGAKACHWLACEVGPIVGDVGLRKPKAIHDILLEEVDNLLPCDVGERYSFHLLSEVVCCYQH